jgi:AcrR family transcriptional regulator
MSKGAKQTAKAEQILQGAMQEFLQHGYTATSMARIAATAGVSKETLYSYFESKEKLFAAIVERTAQQHFQEVFASEPLPADPAPTVAPTRSQKPISGKPQPDADELLPLDCGRIWTLPASSGVVRGAV